MRRIKVCPEIQPENRRDVKNGMTHVIARTLSFNWHFSYCKVYRPDPEFYFFDFL